MRSPDRRRQGAFAGIWSVVARIPPGRVATYGQIARMAGLPGAARTVGWALGALPADRAPGGRDGPWHRVINATGRVSARGPGDDACRRQLARLRREGVRPAADGVIDLERFGWDGRAGSGRVPARRARDAG
jgi:methylated-DNA-protein-cysteine methyltransferase-like protein